MNTYSDLDLPLTDAHNHLQDDALLSVRSELLNSLYLPGSCLAVVNSSHPGDWPKVARITASTSNLIPAYGLHPWFILEAPQDWRDRLVPFLKTAGSSVGEIGIDAGKGRPALDLQTTVCRDQIELAVEYRLPVSFHCHKAWPQLMTLIRETRGGLTRFVLHSFQGPLRMVEDLADLGAYFSLAPSFFRLSQNQRRIYYDRIPPDRLLLESDAPNQFLPRSFNDANGTDPRIIRSLFDLVARDLSEEGTTFTRRIAANFRRAFQ